MQVSVNPNPFYDQTTVYLHGNQEGIVRYELVDLRGVLIKEGSFQGNYLTIPRNDLVSGIYFLSLRTKYGRSIQRQIVVL